MDSKFSPEKELPEPQFQLQDVRAALFCSPNYEQSSTSHQVPPVQSVQPQPQPVAIPTVAPSVPPPPPHDEWVISQNGNFPPQAVHAGYDIDDAVMYVGRVFHNGEYIPAKVFPTHACYPYQGHEFVVENFEYLVGDKYIWVPGQPFPPGAVFTNTLSQNGRLYVGRSSHGGSLLCGKFIRSYNCLYVPFGGREIPITNNFEILVHRDRYMSSIYN